MVVVPYFMPIGEFPKPCKCSICDQEVRYTDRKRCIKCSKWIHNWCGFEPKGSLRTKCYECFPPFSTMEHVHHVLNQLDETWEPGVFESGVVYLASFHIGTDEKAISDFTGISLEGVHWRADNLRNSGLWVDGQVCCDGSDEPGYANIGLILGVLCANGELRRANPSEPSDPQESTGSKSTTPNAGTERASNTDTKA